MNLRYLILSVGYNHVAVPYTSGAELAAAMALLAEAKHVTSVGYGDEQKWTPSSEEPLQMQLVEGTRVTIGDDLATLRVQLKAATDQAESNQKNWMSYYQKNQELEKKLKALQTPADPTPPPAADPTPADDLAF